MNTALLLNFTRQDFVDRYSGSALGTIWAFIHPLALIFIFTVIFANIMGARLPGVTSTFGYSVYLVAGLLPWMAFASTLIRSATVFTDKKPILSKVAVSLPHLPLYIVLSESLTFGITLLIFFGFLLISGIELGLSLLLLPVIFALQQLLAFALGLIFGILNVFLRDIREMVTVLTTFWFWLTPIVWVLDIAPGRVQDLQSLLNPAYFFISAYQQIFVYATLPDMTLLLKLAVIALVALTLALLLARTLERDVRDFL